MRSPRSISTPTVFCICATGAWSPSTCPAPRPLTKSSETFMPDLRKLGIGSIEALLILVIAVMVIGLSASTSTFLTLPNLFDLLNQSSVNIIFAVGLLVVLIAGGTDLSFAVGPSVVQYLTALTVMRLGGGNWALGFIVSACFGVVLGSINATIIYRVRIVSIG